MCMHVVSILKLFVVGLRMNILHAVLCIQEYSEDSNSEPNVDLENQYYNSKALKEDDPKAALSSFQKVGAALSQSLLCESPHMTIRILNSSSLLLFV